LYKKTSFQNVEMIACLIISSFEKAVQGYLYCASFNFLEATKKGELVMRGNKRVAREGAFAALLAVAIWSPSFANFSYPGCTDLAASDFKEIVLVGRSNSVNGITPLAVDANLLEPVGMYVHKDGKVYWAERTTAGNSGVQTGVGRVKVFDPTNNSVTTVLTLPVAAGVASGQSGNSELGLRFVTLHPNFSVNRWAFIYYMPRTSATARGVDTMRVSRFNVLSSGMFDTTSEKIILKMPWNPGICCHQGGAMDWDNKGNLYITTGNNAENSDGYAPMVTTLLGSTGENKDRATQDNQARASNTNDWRGKLLRIHPDSSSKGYSIPAGNLRARFFELGGAWVVGQDTNKILPEIYSFGTRNAYSVSVDTINGWVTNGTVGNDQTTYNASRGPAGNDEFDINTKPQFNGWPYFVGRRRPDPAGWDSSAYVMMDPAVGTTAGYTLPRQSMDSVYNNSPNNTGVTKLIPATDCVLPESKQGAWNTGVPAVFGTSGGTAATTGPIYHYNQYPNSAKKWPPHLDGKWIIAESARNHVYIATPNSTGTAITDAQVIPGDATVFRPSGSYGIIDMKMGPEGVLYIVHYSSAYFQSAATTRISRVEYQGSCTGSSPVLSQRIKKDPARGVLLSNLDHGRLTWPEGMRTAEIYDLHGRKVWTGGRVDDEAASSIPVDLTTGIYRAIFKP
jgi:cytochrome c